MDIRDNKYTLELVDLAQQASNASILVTGATGFLGSNFVFWRLRQGGRVHVLVRGDDRAQAQARVMAALTECSLAYDMPIPEHAADNLRVILGDVSHLLCGVAEDDLDEMAVAGIAEFWHCAASLKFEDKDREELRAHNVEGVTNVLSLCKRIQAAKFIQVSTAYVSGNVKGVVPESIDRDNNKYSNAYEETKKLGELQVEAVAGDLGINYCIVRPSIIVGPYATRRSGGTRFGVYGFIKEVVRLKKAIGDMRTQLRLEGEHGALANLISVDQVVYDMLYLSSIGFGEQKIYHLSNSDLEIGRLVETIDRAVGLHCMSLVDNIDSEQSQFEKLFASRSRFYAGYYRTSKTFFRSLPRHRDINYADFGVYLSSFLKELDNERDGIEFSRHVVDATDGERLCVSSLGNPSGELVVLANAYGMSSDFMVPMAKNLAARGYFVVTWDTRWVPVLSSEFDVAKCNSTTHANDLADIISFFGRKQASLVSWSSGAQVAIRFMATRPRQVKAAVLLNPGTSLPIDLDDRRLTEFEKNIHGLFPVIAESRKMARKYCDVVFGAAGSLEDKNMVGAMLGSIDPYVLHLTSAPFRGVESLYRYANMMDQLFQEEGEPLLQKVESPVLVYVGARDVVIHPDIGRVLQKRIPGAQLVTDPDGGHFAHYSDDSVYKVIDNFVSKSSEARMLVAQA